MKDKEEHTNLSSAEPETKRIGSFEQINNHIKKNFYVYLVSGVAILLCLIMLVKIDSIEEQTDKKYRRYIETYCIKRDYRGLNNTESSDLSKLDFSFNIEEYAIQEGEII